MNTYWLLGVLFITWWVNAPISELCGRRLAKARDGQPWEEVDNTGVSSVAYWFASIMFFGVAKAVDWLASPWGTDLVGWLTVALLVASWISIPLNIWQLKRLRENSRSI
ncbi:MAG: hypothetical protein ACE5KM_08600 [Planctomycetaceae bacterium]